MGSIFAVSVFRSLILPEGFFRGAGVGVGAVIYPNEFFFCLLTWNETENNLDGSIRKDTGHLSGFLSRAMVNYRNIKMRGGLRSIPLGFLFLSILSSVFSLGSSPFQQQ